MWLTNKVTGKATQIPKQIGQYHTSDSGNHARILLNSVEIVINVLMTATIEAQLIRFRVTCEFINDL
jgi:hypothetical protein